jgi:hypothetical protein
VADPEQIDMSERVFKGMVHRCRDYRRTAAQITACENQREKADERGRAVLDAVIARLKKHLEQFPPTVTSSSTPTRHWQDGDDR